MDDLMSTGACTMPTSQRPLRLAEFDALFASAAYSVHRDRNTVRVHLVGSHGLREQVRDLAERETACCSFFTFTLEGRANDLVMDISVPAGRRAILDALADRAEELIA
jgi:hypothetical protein